MLKSDYEVPTADYSTNPHYDDSNNNNNGLSSGDIPTLELLIILITSLAVGYATDATVV